MLLRMNVGSHVAIENVENKIECTLSTGLGVIYAENHTFYAYAGISAQRIYVHCMGRFLYIWIVALDYQHRS